MKQLISLVLTFFVFLGLQAQGEGRQWLSHVDVAATVGTAGVGFDVAMTVNDHLQLRSGFSYMPRFKASIDLGLALEDGFEGITDKEEKREQNRKLKQLLGMLSDLTGMEADSKVMVEVKPIYYNGKILLDWYPFADKSWHFTAGMYFGPSHIGTARNYDSETSFLLALNGYNTIYQHVLDQTDVIHVGDQGFEFEPEINEKFLNYGRATFYIGPRKDGTYYHAVPLEDGTVHADCYANAIKPFVGFGYGQTIGRTGRCTLSFEGGALFWGGTPRVITHEGVDLAHDMSYIKKNYLRHLVDGISALKAFPLLEARLAWRIF